MAELLITELRFVGLELNASRTKILHADCEGEGYYDDTTDVAGNIVEILHGDVFHRYLGRRINLSANRCDIEYNYRKQQAWYAFKKHEKFC